MVKRPFWFERVAQVWARRPVVWLSGVRRVGKTTLARMLGPATFLNCDLPSVGRRLADPEGFLADLDPDGAIVLDEIDRLEDPSGLLKIAADEHPSLRVLATGSSTLTATRKFRDSLTGRKTSLYLAPILWSECRRFRIRSLDRRLLHGGLPEALLARRKDPSFFSEWIDSYYARDIQELFRVRNRTGFLRLFRLLLMQSGGLTDFSSLASDSGLSRPTVMAHIEALQVAHAILLVPPFHGGGRREIVRRPKVYGFDTGFVTFVRGWDSIRDEDRGVLWEHLVLDELRARVDEGAIAYWRDKSGRELDFVIKRPKGAVDVIECKVDPSRFDPGVLKVFRSLYPEGRNFVTGPRVEAPYRRRYGDITVTCGTPADLLDVQPPRSGRSRKKAASTPAGSAGSRSGG
jgi:predicted AAA+ superfamily ATPase